LVARIVDDLLTAYLVVLVVRVVLSYFPIHSGSPVMPVVRFTTAVTEPVLAPLRRVIPAMRVGAQAIDFSPMVVMLAIIILIQLVGS
jgi:YggT family protein